MDDFGEVAVAPCTIEMDWVDERTLRLNLGKDRRFHSGKNVTSAAVVWNLERVREKGGAFNWEEYKNIADVAGSKDGTEVLVHTQRAYSPLPGLLANGLGLVDPQYGLPPRNLTGYGPMRIRESTREGLVMERLDDNMPFIWTYADSHSEALEIARRGAADVLTGFDVGPPELPGDWRVVTCDGLGPMHITFNLRKEPASSREFRLLCANAVFEADAPSDQDITPGSGPIAAWHRGEVAQPPQPSLVERAFDGSLVQLEAGSGAPAKAAHRIAEVLRGRLGLDVNVAVFDNEAWWPDRYMAARWDVAIQSWTPMADPQLVYGRRYATNGLHNATGYSNRTMDELIQKATSHDNRCDTYAEVEALRRQDVPSFYLGFPRLRLAHSPRAAGVSIRNTWHIDLTKAAIGRRS